MLHTSICLPDGRGGYSGWAVRARLSEDFAGREVKLREKWRDEADEDDEDPGDVLVVRAVTRTNSAEIERVFNLMLTYAYELGFRGGPWHMA